MGSAFLPKPETTRVTSEITIAAKTADQKLFTSKLSLQRATSIKIAALITTTAMLGSLYFSEIVNYVPCRLCWYQRATMYPLAILLIVANFKKFKFMKTAAVSHASVGGAIAVYHWFLERFPDLDAGVCDAKLPCSVVWFENFGFVTLAFMAFTAFFTTLVLVTIRSTEK